MDTTSLVLAVDSTQVNSASAALQKMAGEGFKAESVVAKLANTATLQGRALNSGIVKNAAAAADSIKSLTGATSALSNAQDFSRTTSGLAAAATQANAAAGAVRAFGAAIAASAAAGTAASFEAVGAPKTTTVQQIASTPVSVLARSAQSAGVSPAGEMDSKSTVTATNALDKFADQSAKAKNAVENFTSAAQEQGRVLGASVAPNAEKAAGSIRDFANAGGAAAGIASTSSALSAAAAQANAAAAAIGNMKAQATKPPGNFNPFGSLGNAAKPVEDLGKSAKLTAFQTQQLSFQLNDLFVQVASGQSPLTALIQQGSQLNGTFGGIGGTFRALASLITPTTAAIGGAAVAVGGLAYAYMQGAAQSKAFNDAILLSGNYAGQTNGSINRLAESVAESTRSSVGSVREFANALISTGEIGPRAMALATDAVVRYSEATSKTAQEAAADFAKMARDPAKFAQELNRSWNAWTAAELEAIEAMQEGGRVGDAQVEVLKRMQERLQGLHQNMGDVENAQRTLSTAMGNLKDGFYAIGRDRTLEDRLKSLKQLFAETSGEGDLFARGLSKLNSLMGVTPEKRQNFYANSPNAQEDYRTLQAENFRKLDRENTRALEAAAEKETTERNKRLDAIYKRSKPSDELKKALAKNEADFRAAADRGDPVPAAKQKAIQDQTRKELSPPKGPSGRKGEQIDKAQLAYDLEEISKAADAEINIYANAEKIMEARRAAGLIDERQYYQEKLGFIQLVSQAQEAALIKEIERMQAEKLAGKDAIDNSRKILDAEAKLAKVRAESATSQEVNAIQAVAANQRIAKSYIEARQAAQQYLESTNKQYERELAGIGQGQVSRNRDAGIAQIEDRYQGQRTDLNNSKTLLEFEGKFTEDARKQYNERLAIINEFQARSISSYQGYYARLLAAQSDWTNGAREALQNYADDSRNIAKQTEEAFTNAFHGLEDALVNFTQTGKLDFKSLVSSINADIARIAIKESITGPLAGFLKDAIGGGKPSPLAGKKTPDIANQADIVNASTTALTAQTDAQRALTSAIGEGTTSVRDVTERQREQVTVLGDGKTALEQGRVALDDHRAALEAATKAANDFATAAAKPGTGAGGSSGSSGGGLFGGSGSSGGGLSGLSGGSGASGTSLADVPLDTGASGSILFSGGTTMVRAGETAPASDTSRALPAAVAATAVAASATAASTKAATTTKANTNSTAANTESTKDNTKSSNKVSGILAGLLTTGGLMSAFTDSKSSNGAFAFSSSDAILKNVATPLFNPDQSQAVDLSSITRNPASFDGTLADGSLNVDLAAKAAIFQAKSAVDYSGVAAAGSGSTIAGQISGLFGDKTGAAGGSILSAIGGFAGAATGIPGGSILGGMLAKKLGTVKLDDIKPFTDSVQDKTKEGFDDLGTRASAGNMGIDGFFGSMEKSLSSGFGDMSSLFANVGGASSGASSGGFGGIFGSLFGGGSASGMATNSAGMASGQGVSAEALANMMQYGLAGGGLVKGSGTGTSDSIPAALSNGEFVVPAKATSAFLPVLEAMRSGQSSASVLGGLLGRLGVGDSAKASALRIHGARELGGPVSAGKLYRVNEKRPELLNVGNKQFLMMGSQGGKVDPNTQASGGGQPAVIFNNYQSFAPGTDRTTTTQAAAQAANASRRAHSRIN